jgi:hypothetical protein
VLCRYLSVNKPSNEVFKIPGLWFQEYIDLYLGENFSRAAKYTVHYNSEVGFVKVKWEGSDTDIIELIRIKK